LPHPPPPSLYTLSLHDALPISPRKSPRPMKSRSLTQLELLRRRITRLDEASVDRLYGLEPVWEPGSAAPGVALEEFVAVRCPYRSEEHTSELQSRSDLVCRLLL